MKTFHGGLIHFDMTHKPAYDMMNELFPHRFRTEADGQTDDRGCAAFRGFEGDYELTVTAKRRLPCAGTAVKSRYNDAVQHKRRNHRHDPGMDGGALRGRPSQGGGQVSGRAVWHTLGPIFCKGYESQFIVEQRPEFKEDGTVNRKLLGRAVTAMYAPVRASSSNAMARAKGLSGTPNQWVIDSLKDRDVIVIDMFDKVYAEPDTAIHQKTGNGGAVSYRDRVDAQRAGRAGVLSWH